MIWPIIAMDPHMLKKLSMCSEHFVACIVTFGEQACRDVIHHSAFDHPSNCTVIFLVLDSLVFIICIKIILALVESLDSLRVILLENEYQILIAVGYELILFVDLIYGDEFLVVVSHIVGFL